MLEGSLVHKDQIGASGRSKFCPSTIRIRDAGGRSGKKIFGPRTGLRLKVFLKNIMLSLVQAPIGQPKSMLAHDHWNDRTLPPPPPLKKKALGVTGRRVRSSELGEGDPSWEWASHVECWRWGQEGRSEPGGLQGHTGVKGVSGACIGAKEGDRSWEGLWPTGLCQGRGKGRGCWVRASGPGKEIKASGLQCHTGGGASSSCTGLREGDQSFGWWCDRVELGMVAGSHEAGDGSEVIESGDARDSEMVRG